MLGTFEERLTKLEENILPIYKETEDFQRLQVNVDQTLESLDSVIDFYTIGKEVENLIRHSILVTTVRSYVWFMSFGQSVE